MLAGFGLSAFLSPTVYPLGLFILFLGCGLLFALADAVSPAGFWAGLCTFSFGLGVALGGGDHGMTPRSQRQCGALAEA